MTRARLLKFPIIANVVFVLLTLLMNLFGPKEYFNYDNKIGMSLYILTYLVVVYFGFNKGLRSKLYCDKKRYKGLLNSESFVLTCIKITCFLYIVNTVYLIVNNSFSLNVLSMGQNYNDYYDYYRDKKEGSLFTYENVFLVVSALPQFLATVLGFLRYAKFSKHNRTYFIFMLCLIIANNTISNGNQKSIGDIFIYFFVALLYYVYLNPEQTKKVVRIVLISGVLLLSVLSYSQYNRVENGGIVNLSDVNYRMSYSSYNFNHPVFKILGPKLGIAFSEFTTGYLSDGYYGLSKCLELPFRWTYGVGSSLGICTIVEKITGAKVYQKTYLGRMEEEYSSLNISGTRGWHTIFPWLASDMTFPGALFFLFLMSYLYGKSWKEVVIFGNKASYLLFALLSALFIFVPCNNQIFHGYNALVVAAFVFIYWFMHHSEYNHVKQIS